MHLKIRCDGKSEKIYKFFWELNKALVIPDLGQPIPWASKFAMWDIVPKYPARKDVILLGLQHCN